MKNYALYMASELAMEEEILETGGTPDKINCSSVVNSKLGLIETELESVKKGLNGLNCYLLGIVYKQRNRKKDAKESLIAAL
jgi:hypothetical protein